MDSSVIYKHENVINAEEDLETKEEKKHLLKKKFGMNMYLKSKHSEN